MKRLFKSKWMYVIATCLLLVTVTLQLIPQEEEAMVAEPTLTVQSPQKLSASEDSEFTLDVTISSLADALYPAMSMSLPFDSSRLEFLGVEEGNVFVLSHENSTGRQLPNWSCDPPSANECGVINVMYLDMTGGKNAFTAELLEEDDNVLLRLRFRLRGSVSAGDVVELMPTDAVFAASDEAQSLAMAADSLKVKHARVVIGE